MRGPAPVARMRLPHCRCARSTHPLEYEWIEFAREFVRVVPAGRCVFIAKKEINARLTLQGGPMSKSSNRRKFVRRPLSYPAKIVATDGSLGRNRRVLD